MRSALLIAILLAGCSQTEGGPVLADNSDTASQPGGAAPKWDMQSSGEGAALVVADASGEAAMRLFCPSGQSRLIVNVPAFDAIGSEERLSFGQSGNVVALVADSSGDQQRGGVSGEGPVPADLVTLVSGGVSASYGAQVSGPHPTPPAALVNAFAKACSDGPSAEESVTPEPQQPGGSACLTGRDGKPVPANRLRAVGTEPFWGAIVEGRCVTYSHPENQSGTRVWTEFSGTAENGTWTGSLEGKPFVMRTRPQPGCSDGMSDRRYPVAVSLTVGGGERSGCAHPQ